MLAIPKCLETWDKEYGVVLSQDGNTVALGERLKF